MFCPWSRFKKKSKSHNDACFYCLSNWVLILKRSKHFIYLAISTIYKNEATLMYKQLQTNTHIKRILQIFTKHWIKIKPKNKILQHLLPLKMFSCSLCSFNFFLWFYFYFFVHFVLVMSIEWFWWIAVINLWRTQLKCYKKDTRSCSYTHTHTYTRAIPPSPSPGCWLFAAT